MIGVNDLNANRTLDAMESGYREILHQIKDRAHHHRVASSGAADPVGVFAGETRL